MVDVADIKARTDLLTLIEQDTPLRKTTHTNGGEYHGPCPFCGGHDRFIVWPDADRPGFWCRQCDRKGDAIQYMRDRDKLTFPQAVEALGGDPRIASRPARPRPPSQSIKDLAPSEDWQRQARGVVEACEATLWTDDGERARTWLDDRGLTDETLRRWRIGFNPKRQAVDGLLWVDRGITIPWFADGQIWHVNVRCAAGEPRYKAIAGGHPYLFGADDLTGHRTAVLTEGEFDAMLLHQEASDLVEIASLGSASKGLSQRAISVLLPISRILVAYDMDESGERGAAKLGSVSARMRRVSLPVGKDITEFHQAGGRLRDWVEYQLAKHVPAADGITVSTGLSEACDVDSCHRPVYRYSSCGKAMCELHVRTEEMLD